LLKAASCGETTWEKPRWVGQTPTDCVAFERRGQTSEPSKLLLFRSSKITVKNMFVLLHFGLKKFPHLSPFCVRFPRFRFDLPPALQAHPARCLQHTQTDTMLGVSVSVCKHNCRRPADWVCVKFSREERRGVKTAVLSVLAFVPSRVIVAVRGEL